MKVWIDSRNELLEVFESLTNEKYIGLDTEFIRTNTFFTELALIQLSDGEKCWLVDVLSINDPTIFKAFFESGRNQFVMHACAEDLEVLHRAYDIELTNIFDSQVGIQSSALQVRRGPEALHQFVSDLRATCTQILNAQTGSTFSVSLKFIKSDADIILGRTCMSSLILELYITVENFIFPAFSFSVMAKFVGGCELHALHLRYSSLEILQALRKVSNFHRKQPDCDCRVVGSELIVKEKRLLPEHTYVGMNIKKKTLQSILLSSVTTKNSS